MKLFTQKNILNFPTKAKKIFDVTGAGDTVLATLGVAIASNITLENSIELANIAAAVVIGKVGTATPTFTEIIQFGNQKILSWNDLKAILDLNRDKKIVFTNGCFDILHVGHLKYLEKAKELGDILVVAINSDSSVRKIKGEKRPINLEDDRAYLLSGLACVDYVTIFSEETPYKIIDFLKPNILVKGADYKNKEVVGSNLVDEVKLIEFVTGKSTTNIIDKICQKYS
jgi:D-beta-D-heptose 7-phosphate kinase/D-beta-D-heptose 1-phosphate adenosyltransferase